MSKTTDKCGPKQAQRALAYLKAAYPGFRPSKDEWESISRRYVSEIAEYPRAVVARSMRRAPHAFPRWFPQLGELLELVQAEHRSWVNRQVDLRPMAGPCLGQACFGATDSAEEPQYELVARRWEEEDRQGPADGTEAGTRAKNRIAVIAEMLGRVGGE